MSFGRGRWVQRVAPAGFDLTTLTNRARPPAGWRAWREDSPFNRPLTGSPVLYGDSSGRNSDGIIAYLAASSAVPATRIFNPGNTSADFNHPWYFATAADALVTVRNRYNSSYASQYGGNFGTAETEGLQFRVPLAALPAGTATTNPSGTPTVYNLPAEDSHMHVVQPDGVTVLTMYRVERGWVGGGDIWCRWSAVEPLTGDGLTRSDKVGSTAARYAGAPMVRIEELAAGEIRHALFLNTHRTRGIVYPASGAGTEVTDTQAPPMGARFQYKKPVEFINAQPWPAWVKTFMRALRVYGAYVGDTGGATTDVMAFKIESDQVYRSFPTEFPTPVSETWAIANSVPSRVSGSLGRTVYELIFSSYSISVSDFQVVAVGQ